MNQDKHPLLTLAEAAAYLRVHRRTMNHLLREGLVPGVRVGRQWRVRKADLEATVAGRTAGEPNADGSDGRGQDP